jgi:hypothetical protein
LQAKESNKNLLNEAKRTQKKSDSESWLIVTCPSW